MVLKSDEEYQRVLAEQHQRLALLEERIIGAVIALYPLGEVQIVNITPDDMDGIILKVKIK